MADKIEEESWGADLTRKIAERIRGARLANGMSAQDLADRTAQLGHPVSRQVIANLEGQRKRNVTLDDLFVIAHALEVSPLILIFDPYKLGAPFEILPGLTVPEWEAVRWLRAERGIVGGLYMDDFDSGRSLLNLRATLDRNMQDAEDLLRDIDYLEIRRRDRRGNALSDDEVDARVSGLRRQLDLVQREQRHNEQNLDREGVDYESSWFSPDSVIEYRAHVFDPEDEDEDGER